MSVLDGHYFSATDISTVLADGANYAMKQYMSTDDPAWLSANVSIVSTKTKINSMADAEAAPGGTLNAIKKGMPLWSEIDAVLVPVASAVADDVDALPIDDGPLASAPAWVRPAVVGGALAVVLTLGYWWVHKK